MPLEPIAVINAKEEWIETGNDCMKTILENYKITNNEKDLVYSKDIEEFLKERKIGISMKKWRKRYGDNLNTILRKCNIFGHQTNIYALVTKYLI